jgi:hypothetical protein
MVVPKLCWCIGFLLFGLIMVPQNVILRRLRGVGYKTQAFDWTANGKFNLPVEYLKIRAQHGWSPWPVYSMVLMLLAGVGFILLGLVWSS